jgi:transcriptional regulator with XRE-family HTH domain
MTRERTDAPPRRSDGEEPAFYEGMGRAVKVLRTQFGLSRKELAAASGLSYAYLADIETGRGRPSSKALLAIAQALGVSASTLMREAERYEARAIGDDAPADAAASRASSAAAIDEPTPPPESRWFHTSADRGVTMMAAEPDDAPTRRDLQRLARSRIAGQREQMRAEILAIVDGLPQEDVEMVLWLARRLLRP